MWQANGKKKKGEKSIFKLNTGMRRFSLIVIRAIEEDEIKFREKD